MFYEIYTQWFSEQSDTVRKICARVSKTHYLNGNRFKRIEQKK